MGASSSTTRRLTVKNEDPRIVQVTEDVVSRLRTAGASPVVAAQASDVLHSIDAGAGDENAVPVGGQAGYTETAGVLAVGSHGRPIIETVTAYHVRKQKEAELRNNDILWAKKLKDLETRYATSAFASQEEFDSKLSKLKSLVPKPRQAPCSNLSSKVAECYKLNSKQTLKCADEVKHFAQCVDNSRAA